MSNTKSMQVTVHKRRRAGVVALMVTAALSVAGCGAVRAPVVDMDGVDPAQHNRDVAECYRTIPAFAVGNPITDCMKKKGYTILVGY